MKQFISKIKKLFLTGLLILIPIFVTIYIAIGMINFIDSIGNILPKKLNPETYLPFHIPGLGIIYTVILALTTGLLVRNYVGKKALCYWEMIVDKIPLVRVLYSALRQVSEAIFVKGDTQFKKVALIEYPRRGIYSLVFITGRASNKLSANAHPQMIGVFIPTTPNPTSGFYLMVPEEDIINVDISIEDAFKLILSGGMVHPNSTLSNITSQNEPRLK
ncbi:MAG: DUF502 domain-containing protein [Deltaproteobacteria bacterium]|nr:DUF502 domain-containing protein [Deltaproteobacteria bacterium]